jgi:6-phosphogluconolactonase
MQFYKITDTDTVANYIAKNISAQLKRNNKVLWLIAGGSVTKIAASICNKLPGSNLNNLSVTLTDERFVALNDPESNWQQLDNSGFKLKRAELYPVLNSTNIEQSTKNYDELLKRLLKSAEYKIALFGMGADGHIAALFPDFAQLHETEKYALSFSNSPKPPAQRITMTFAAIEELDEAVLFAAGDEKRPAIEKLNQDISIDEQPAQFLKKLPKLTIFNDRIGDTL